MHTSDTDPDFQPSTATRMLAGRTAARVDSSKVGFDPITILTILTTVLPLVIQCFSKDKTPAEAMGSLREFNETNPGALLRKTARRIRGEADQPMTKAASFELAKAVIAEALASDPPTVSACYAEMIQE